MTYIQLYASVKAAFIARHTSLNKWCIANNVHRQNARSALLNERKEKWAIELRMRIAVDAGIDMDCIEDNSNENVA